MFVPIDSRLNEILNINHFSFVHLFIHDSHSFRFNSRISIEKTSLKFYNLN